MQTNIKVNLVQNFLLCCFVDYDLDQLTHLLDGSGSLSTTEACLAAPEGDAQQVTLLFMDPNTGERVATKGDISQTDACFDQMTLPESMQEPTGPLRVMTFRETETGADSSQEDLYLFRELREHRTFTSSVS